MMIFGFETMDLVIFIAISLLICITVCSLAMEAAVLFVPAFLFLFPGFIIGFPTVTPNEAIGLAITVEFFGYTSSVLGYWFRKQVDIRLGLRVLAYTVPFAILARVSAFFIPESGLLIVFGVILLVLAVIIFRAYRSDIRHGCLLCGDSIAAMRMGDGEDEAEPVAGRPNLGKSIPFGFVDRAIVSSAGIFAGTTGVAIGEITNTFLSIRKKVPIKVGTGTAAFVLHITILSALCANLVVLFGDFQFIDVEEIVIPWRIAFILAPVVVVGGQIGSMLNSRLSDQMLMKLMMTAYTLVGIFVLVNVFVS